RGARRLRCAAPAEHRAGGRDADRAGHPRGAAAGHADGRVTVDRGSDRDRERTRMDEQTVVDERPRLPRRWADFVARYAGLTVSSDRLVELDPHGIELTRRALAARESAESAGPSGGEPER